ncbi:hypothetical protein V1511DRAFT_492540 [Dipodascopsis uninucleata]
MDDADNASSSVDNVDSSTDQMSTAAASSSDLNSTYETPSELIDRLSRTDLPNKTPEERREDSPDNIGSIDALADRFATLFNRPPTSVQRPLNDANSYESAKHVFLGMDASADKESLEQVHSWRDLPEVDDDEFEKALLELSSKEWELTPADLAELQYLEKTAILPNEGSNDELKDIDSKYMSDGYWYAIKDDLNGTGTSNDDLGSMKASADSSFDKEISDLTDRAKKLRIEYDSQNTSMVTDGKCEANGNLTSTESNAGLTKEEHAEFDSEKRDIEDQADRLVQMYASMTDAELAEDDDDVGDEEEKDEDAQANELVDMYVRLASDSEDADTDLSIEETNYPNQVQPSETVNVSKSMLPDTTGLLLARLQSLKSPLQINSQAPGDTLTSNDSLSNGSERTNVNNGQSLDGLPEIPTMDLPSVPVDQDPKTRKLREDAELGCCICAKDVQYRCLGCEKFDEDYLYCGKCFLLTHQGEDAGYEERTHAYKKFKI